MSCNNYIPIIMKELSTIEMSQLMGGSWSECDKVIILGNTSTDHWTEKMWADWLADYEKHCAKSKEEPGDQPENPEN